MQIQVSVCRFSTFEFPYKGERAMKNVILHAFNWSYQLIADRAIDIARAGYGAVLFPPPLYSDESRQEWWQVYQPKDYRVLRSHLGRKADIARAIQALKRAGVQCYADIVFNHMANESRLDRFQFPGEDTLTQYAQDPSFREDQLYGDLSRGLFDEHDFHPDRNILDWTDNQEVVDREISGLPDLVLSIAVVQEQIECLQHLIELGFDGFRADAVKHLPVDHVISVFQSMPLTEKFVFGETLTFDNNQNIKFLWPIIHETSIACYDFALQQTMKQAFQIGGSLRALADPAACGNALPWYRAVTFAVTHDVPNNDGFRGMLLDGQDEYLANAYVLGRDGGVPLIYSDHGESSDRHPEDQGRWQECWSRYDIVQMIGFHNAVQGMSQRNLWEDDGFLVFARGDKGIVALNKTDQWVSPTINTFGLCQGAYRCQIHQHIMQLQGEQFQFSIPPRQAQLWLFQN
jgi:alpha-amylase